MGINYVRYYWCNDDRLAVIGTTLALLGGLGSQAIIGGAALIVAGIAMILIAKSLKEVAPHTGAIIPFTLGILALAAAFTLIGNPFTIAFTFAGAAAGLLIGGATLLIAKGLAEFKKTGVSGKDAENAANVIDIFVTKIGDVFSGMFFKLPAIMLGVAAMSGLGNMMTDLAGGIRSMASLEFVEHEIRNGKLVPKRVIKLTDKHFEAVGTNMGKIITSLTKPISDIGKNEGLFGGDFSDGVDALGGLGSILATTAEGVQAMADLKFIKYKVVGGRLVPDEVVQLTDEDFKNVGINFGRIIDSIRKPISDIGAGGGVFTDSDFKNGLDDLEGLGNVINPVVKLVETMSKLKTEDVEKSGTNLGDSLAGISKALTKVENMEFDTDSWEDAIELLEDLSDIDDASNIATAFTEVADSMERINAAIEPKKFKQLMLFKDAVDDLAKGEMAKNLEDVLERITAKLTDTLQQVKKAIEASSNPIAQKQAQAKMAVVEKQLVAAPQAANANKELTVVTEGLNEIASILKSGIDVNVTNQDNF